MTSAGSVRVTGAIARQRAGRDTMNVRATVFLGQLRPLLQAMSAGDSIAPDSIRTVLDSASGTINATAQVTGSIDSMAVDAQLNGERLSLAPARMSRLEATASLSGMPGAIRGRFVLRADSVMTQGARFSMVSASALNSDSTWLVRLSTSPDDRPGGETAGSVSLRADTVIIGIDSLLVRVPGSDLQLARPTRIRRSSSRRGLVGPVTAPDHRRIGSSEASRRDGRRSSSTRRMAASPT
jgi:hypothetical protein